MKNTIRAGLRLILVIYFQFSISDLDAGLALG